MVWSCILNWNKKAKKLNEKKLNAYQKPNSSYVDCLPQPPILSRNRHFTNHRSKTFCKNPKTQL